MRLLRSCYAAWRVPLVLRGGRLLTVSALASSCSLGVHDHQTPEIEPDVMLYDYSVSVAKSEVVLASGCVATMGSASFEGELSVGVPLEQELVFEYRAVGTHEGSISDESPQESFCRVGPTDAVGAGAAEYNPKCLVSGDSEIFDVLSLDLIGHDGRAVDWGSDDTWLVSAIGLRVHIIQHGYGIVALAVDRPPCEERRWIGLYTAVPPEEAEEAEEE